ncbi:maleylacetate reductase [Peribacillus huizhouensis]|uniref:Maleylacetate reductase n=1 Tax=Peribacillus huizhouensis TaxID=1501239 RepID=A0ABR6CQ91_9BACI|nr:maleylacetate reductase [Peribacillus huizhouensis]MBA9027198.1 maleylacetate reductase [Peribacillus huizhouensis]
MKNFIYEALATRVIFGAGEIRKVQSELKNISVKRALVISTPGQEELAIKISSLLGDLCTGIHAKAVQHVPMETVEKSVKLVSELNIDSLVPVGGGSSIGLAKAIALYTSLPIVAIPTTYAGSEMTPIWGITENGIKKTGKDVVVKPKSVIYDPELSVNLPVRVSVTSGLNAMAHCVEGLYAENTNPIISLLAEEGIRALHSSLPSILVDKNDVVARSKALYGCWLAGTVLGSVGMALHHKLCHVLGGSYNLPHADTHSVILPYALWYNAAYAPDAVQAIARSLGTEKDAVAEALFDLNTSLGGPTSLAKIGMKETDLDQAAELATKNAYYNPRSIDQQSIRQLLEYAFKGKRPEKGIEI